MSALRLPDVSLRHAWSIWQRNLTVYRHTYKMNILPNFFEPVFYLLAMGIGMGSYIALGSGQGYLEFLAPGLVAASAMNGATFETTYNVYVRIAFQRVYEGVLTTPVSASDVAVGEVLWAMTRSLLYGGTFLLVTVIFGYISPATALLGLPLVLLTGLLFGSLGLLFTSLVPNIDMYSYYFTFFLTPLFLFSNTFFPLKERFPEWALWVARFTPLYHAVEVMRAGTSGTFSGEAWFSLGYLVVVSGLLLYLATRFLERRLLK